MALIPASATPALASPKLKAFHYNLVIFAEDHRQADQVLVERVGYDEDLREYGVTDYSNVADPADGRQSEPV